MSAEQTAKVLEINKGNTSDKEKEEKIFSLMNGVDTFLLVETDEDYGLWISNDELDWSNIMTKQFLSKYNYTHDDFLFDGYVYWTECELYVKKNEDL